ncbi:hypothetical protein BAMA_17100 [Bacillus manliponensis]|uniref:Uncharacterized protein n=1 Tax=Bacillus manliponensis TaxID=574376 RepID=A0A073K0X6_9BACI|nr:hypothetical protein [Bacillus manliponensis]KEK20165.1 hypothetical protein BAMA_17100 [Bacillus manliponensis]
MNQISDKVRTYFEEFNQAHNAFKPDLLAPHVIDPLVGADPNGSIQIVSKEDYLAGTEKSQEYLYSLGFQFVNTIPVEEIPLNPYYTLVKTKGTMRLEKTPGEPLDVIHDTIYILYMKDVKPKMVFTLSHEDPMKMAKDQHGISYGEQLSWDEML